MHLTLRHQYLLMAISTHSVQRGVTVKLNEYEGLDLKKPPNQTLQWGLLAYSETKPIDDLFYSLGEEIVKPLLSLAIEALSQDQIFRRQLHTVFYTQQLKTSESSCFSSI